MVRYPLSRVLSLLVVLSLAAAACTSSDSADVSVLGDVETTTTVEGADHSGDDPDATEPVALGGPVDPQSVSDLAVALTGVEVDGDQQGCLLAQSDDDAALAAVFNGWQEPAFQFTPEAFTVLTVNVHSCVDATTLSGSLVGLTGGAGDPLEFTGCLTNEFSAAQTGDLAYVGMAALQVGFPVPEGAQEATIGAASNCIGDDILANQLAAGNEQASGFTVEIDRDCVVDGLDPSFSESFWQGVVIGDASAADTDALLADCTTTFDSGLPTEVPADFTPFSGEGTLAGIDPLSRDGVYSEAPPLLLEDGVDYQAIITTEDGEILIDLYEDAAPIAVNSFVALAQDGFYDGTRFHRVLDNFMAQAGDPTATGSGGPGYSFEDEETGLTPIDARGLLAMANSGPDTNGSQFFITLEAADWLDGLHTVFGEVVEGDDVLGEIELRDPASPTSRGEELISVVIIEA